MSITYYRSCKADGDFLALFINRTDIDMLGNPFLQKLLKGIASFFHVSRAAISGQLENCFTYEFIRFKSQEFFNSLVDIYHFAIHVHEYDPIRHVFNGSGLHTLALLQVSFLLVAVAIRPVESSYALMKFLHFLYELFFGLTGVILTWLFSHRLPPRPNKSCLAERTQKVEPRGRANDSKNTNEKQLDSAQPIKQ